MLVVRPWSISKGPTLQKLVWVRVLLRPSTFEKQLYSQLGFDLKQKKPSDPERVRRLFSLSRAGFLISNMMNRIPIEVLRPFCLGSFCFAYGFSTGGLDDRFHLSDARGWKSTEFRMTLDEVSVRCDIHTKD